jgi:nitrite reductase/ring-hydroxylating ferredoxin subunit
VAEYVVGRVEDIPTGSKRIVDVGGVEIGIFNVRGEFYAIPNHCFHQGGPLCEGNVGATVVASRDSNWKPEWVHEGEIVVCPWHGLEFDVTTGRCLARKRARLRQYRVNVVDGEVRIVA